MRARINDDWEPRDPTTDEQRKRKRRGRKGGSGVSAGMNEFHGRKEAPKAKHNLASGVPGRPRNLTLTGMALAA